MRNRGKSVKISDIAAAANVSPGTVSNALNNRKGVSEVKRRMILETAKRLGYEHVYIDQSELSLHYLVLRKHGHIISDTDHIARIQQGIEAFCQRAHYPLQISQLDLTRRDTKYIIQKIGHSVIDGILVLGSEATESDLSLFQQLNQPIILIDAAFSSCPYDSIHPNNVQGIYAAMNHLVHQGHKQIGYLHSYVQTSNFQMRKQAFHSCAVELGLQIRPAHQILAPPTYEGAYHVMRRIIEHPATPLPTAILCDHDLIASGAAKALIESGRNIPQDIAIIGFGDHASSRYASPDITTIRVDWHSIGTHAVHMLKQRIQGDLPSGSLQCATTCQLVERHSTASYSTVPTS